MPSGQVHLIGGPSGAGKTRLVFQLYKTLQTGADFLGHGTHPVKWAYVAGDRPARSVEETMGMMGVSFPVFSLVDRDLIGADVMNVVIPSLTKFYDERPDFIFIDGFTPMCPDGETNKYLPVAKWLGGIQRYCAKRDVTILGSCHTTKVKEGEKFLNPRQRILGSVAWASFVESIIMIEPDVKDEDKRHVNLLPRNGRGEHYVMTFDEFGFLKEPDTISQAGDVTEFIMNDLIKLQPGDTLKYQIIVGMAAEKGIRKRSLDRWLAGLVENGRVAREKRGEYLVL